VDAAGRRPALRDRRGARSDALIHVDDHELSWADVGKLLLTYGGWGMRIVFVPDDRLDDEPETDVREPDGQE
jgi:hypothetical protein